MQPRSTTCLVFFWTLAASLLVAGCGGGADDPPIITDPPTSSEVVVQPVRLEGGSYVEGFVAGTDIDGERDAIARMAPLDEPVRASVQPGERRVRVVVYPCDGSCPGGWAGFARRYEAELAKPGERLERLEQFVEQCVETIEVEAGAEVHLTPVIDLRDAGTDGPDCAFETDEPGARLRIAALDVRGSFGNDQPRAWVTIEAEGEQASSSSALGERGLERDLTAGTHVVRFQIGTGTSSSVTCEERIDSEAGETVELTPVLEADAHAARCRIERQSATGA